MRMGSVPFFVRYFAFAYGLGGGDEGLANPARSAGPGCPCEGSQAPPLATGGVSVASIGAG
jgi:hypothetical protein